MPVTRARDSSSSQESRENCSWRSIWRALWIGDGEASEADIPLIEAVSANHPEKNEELRRDWIRGELEQKARSLEVFARLPLLPSV